MTDQDCYFFIDESIPELDRTMSVLCVECHDKTPEIGWFYNGSKDGYGPFDYQCSICGNYVHKSNQKATGEYEHKQ